MQSLKSELIGAEACSDFSLFVLVEKYTQIWGAESEFNNLDWQRRRSKICCFACVR